MLTLVTINTIISISLTLLKSAQSSPAKLKLFSYDSVKPYEVTGRKCKAGVFMLEPTEYHCACVTGVWGFYTKFCKRPVQIIGGDNYCFKLDPETKISQVILFGSSRYPFESSLTHFREDFKIMTKTFRVDDETEDMDAVGTFLTVTNKSWTIKGNTEETLCLSSSSDERRIFCLFDLTRGVIDDWREITHVHRGCSPSSSSLEPDSCLEIHPPNDETLCTIESQEDTTLPSSTLTTTPASSPSNTKKLRLNRVDNWGESSTTDSIPTTEMTTIATDKFCQVGVSHNDIRDYWNSPIASLCPRSITELVLTDQLKRIAIHRMNQEIRTRQLSLEQTEELLEIQASLIKITCPKEAVPHEFIDVLTDGFAMFLRDDFFYGVEETESSLYERIIYSLRTCLRRAIPFEFTSEMDDCRTIKILKEVVLDGVPSKIIMDEKQAWRNFEVIIETGWKLFLNSHSYCFEDFLRQNDHHAYSIRMMQLFSNSIYEKWIQPLPTFMLYKYIIPNATNMEIILDNLDTCVGALSYNIKCPLWMDRSASKDSSSSVLEPSNPNPNRKKRSIWIDHLQNNRENTEIWDGAAHCLQTPEDPSYHLGYGRCAHP